MMFILNEEGEPVPEPDTLKWGRWFQTADRSVARDKVGDVTVSTVFLGLNHMFFDGPPLLWETCCFPGDVEERYATREEACWGHVRTVARLFREQEEAKR